ncbi:MAG: ferrous iron transport protein B [Bacteriovoracaceae bacterium]|nr:ferrous iron transport protein B [Bacteriovoracaceae bacterium]
MLKQVEATILLIGFPNAGKSTFFNILTGGTRKVSNYSGVTVDVGHGDIESNKNEGLQLKLIDLPGVYNLIPTSYDEAVTVQSLLDLNDYHQADKVVVLLDYQRLEASLSLGLAVRDVVGDENLVFVINKDDESEINAEMREEIKQRTGVQTLSTSALQNNGKVLDDFLRTLSYANKIDLKNKLPMTEESVKYFRKTPELDRISLKSDTEISSTINWYHDKSRDVLEKVIAPKNTKAKITEKIDRFVLNPFFGGAIFLSIFYMIFHALYTWAGPVMELVETAIGGVGELLTGIMPEGLLQSLIVDGVIGGVGGVLVFLPQIMFLFFLLSLLEQSGYIARAAVVTDKLMGYFGLNGKAFLPYMSGFACAIPGIMAARTLSNPRERVATIMTIPLITCSARLPVYILLIGTFVPKQTVLGIFDSQALSFFFLYFLGSAAALVIAKVLRLSFFKGESGNFIIDLPLYQRPSLKAAFMQAWRKGKAFLKKAGTIILALSIVIWVLSTFPKANPDLLVGKTEAQVASISLEQSMLGTMGRTVEPVIKPIGMDWKMGVGLLVSFGARELFVSAMGTLYALGDVDEESESLRQRLINEKDPVTGKPVYSLAVAWSLLIFFVFALQCTGTMGVLRKELGSWKVPLIMFTYMGTLGYLGSWIVYTYLS